MYRRCSFLSGVLLLLCLAQLATAAETGLLWRVTPEAGLPSHVFGTVHSADPRVLRLAVPVREALDAADSVTLEVALAPETAARMSQAMFYAPGQSAREVLSPELYTRALQALEAADIPPQVAAMMKPWAMVITLSLPSAESGMFLDLALARRAREQGKPVHGLETVAEQIDYFDTMPLPEQRQMLEETLAAGDRLEALHGELIDTWLQRDLAALERLNEVYLADGDPQLAARFRERFIVTRNHLMVARMQPQLEAGGAFIAVGALHLPGPEGILALLRQANYTVEAVY